MKNTLPETHISDIEEKQIDEEKSNVVDLKLVTGGSQPPADGDWLSPLEVGTVFLAKNKQNSNDYSLGLFRIINKTEKSVVLSTPSVTQNLYLIPLVFCRAYVLYENLGVLGFQEEQQEEETQES